jgi:hypothetical protein
LIEVAPVLRIGKGTLHVVRAWGGYPYLLGQGPFPCLVYEASAVRIAVFYKNQKTVCFYLGVERLQVDCRQFRTDLVEDVAAVSDVHLPYLRRKFG